jgi:hypothetical protein
MPAVAAAGDNGTEKKPPGRQGLTGGGFATAVPTSLSSRIIFISLYHFSWLPFAFAHCMASPFIKK